MMGTLGMSAEAVGAYIRLLCYQWDNGAVPDSDDFIKRCGGIANPHAVAEVRLKFGKTSDGLKNARLEEVRAKQEDYRQKQAINGKKRWVGNAKPLPSHMPNACSPSPSPTPSSSPDSNTLAAAKPPRARNEICDALARACNIDPMQMTPRSAQSCAVAAAQIKKVAPTVDQAEFERRAANYRQHFSGAALTPRALCDHWAACDVGPPRQSTTVKWQRPEVTDEEHAKGF